MATTENSKENRDDVDGDGYHGPVSNDSGDCGDVGADVGIKPLKARIAEELSGIVVNRVAGLYSRPMNPSLGFTEVLDALLSSRKAYAAIDTNNYIEFWHNTLKSHFFRNKQHRHPDTGIYVLATLAVPHFQQKCMRSIVNVGRMNPVQAEELQLTLLATEHIKTRKSKGYIGAYISQTSDLTFRVESFTDITAGYDVEVDFSRTPIGHITGCSCKYFHNNRSCCKHIVLVQPEVPLIKFLSADYWEHEANFELGMLESCLQDDSANAAPEVDHIAICIQRLWLLEELRDKKSDYPQRVQLQMKLQETLDLFEATFPRFQGQDLYNKRPRQRY